MLEAVFGANFCGGLAFFITGILLFSRKSSRNCVNALKIDAAKQILPKALRIIELKAPLSLYEQPQRVINNLILAKCINKDSNCKYIINIKSDPTLQLSLLLEYVGEVYSLIWNEAVGKKYLDIDATVLLDQQERSAGSLPKEVGDLHHVVKVIQSRSIVGGNNDSLPIEIIYLPSSSDPSADPLPAAIQQTYASLQQISPAIQFLNASVFIPELSSLQRALLQPVPRQPGTRAISTVSRATANAHKEGKEEEEEEKQLSQGPSTAAAPAIHFLGGCDDSGSFSTRSNARSEPLPRYEAVCLGGTFDHCHAGHRSLLTVAAYLAAQRLTVGITGDAMLSSKLYATYLTPYRQREQAVQDFLHLLAPQLSLHCKQLQDGIGPAGQDAGLQAIVVSSETILGALKINSIRQEKQMPLLDLIVIERRDPVLLSSSFIRSQFKLIADRRSRSEG